MGKSKKPAKQASSTSSPETSKPSLTVRVTDDLLEQLRKLSKDDRKLAGQAINSAANSWGHPHLHSGIGIRRLTKTIFECRVGLDQRLAFAFIVSPPELVFFFMGNHDEIQKLIRSSK